MTVMSSGLPLPGIGDETQSWSYKLEVWGLKEAGTEVLIRDVTKLHDGNCQIVFFKLHSS